MAAGCGSNASGGVDGGVTPDAAGITDAGARDAGDEERDAQAGIDAALNAVSFMELCVE